MNLTVEETFKVKECLAILQEAQTLIDRAAQELCPVRGFADEWSALSTPYQVVKEHWHKVNARFQQIRASAVEEVTP